MWAVFLVGLALRVAAAHLLHPHVDEAESVMAARIVARDGVPLLPSGVLFLQGATLSYLLQPLLDLGADPLALFHLRLVSVLAGAAAVPTLYRLSLALGASPAVAAFAATGLALDAASIEWSAHVRPYALLQLVSVGVLLLWVRAIERPTMLRCVALAVAFAFGVFTHIGVLLLVPPMLLLTSAWAGSRARGVWIALASFVVAPILFLALNRWFGVTTRGPGGPGPSFIGDHLLDVTRFLAPELDAWRALFQRSALRELMPPLVAASIGLLVGRRLLGPGSRPVFLAPLVLYTLPIVAVAFTTSEAQGRYLLHVHPLTWLLVGLALEELLLRGPPGEHQIWRRVGVAGVVAAGIHLVDGAYGRLRWPQVDPSYQRALTWLVERHQPGEPVIAAMTAVAWLTPLPPADVWFLAGPEGGPRTSRYTRLGPHGGVIDYWAGVPAVASTGALCERLSARPGSWLVVDAERLAARWAFAGAMARVVTGSSTLVYSEPDAARVYRSRPRAEWTDAAVTACAAPVDETAPDDPEE